MCTRVWHRRLTKDDDDGMSSIFYLPLFPIFSYPRLSCVHSFHINSPPSFLFSSFLSDQNYIFQKNTRLFIRNDDIYVFDCSTKTGSQYAKLSNIIRLNVTPPSVHPRYLLVFFTPLTLYEVIGGYHWSLSHHLSMITTTNNHTTNPLKSLYQSNKWHRITIQCMPTRELLTHTSCELTTTTLIIDDKRLKLWCDAQLLLGRWWMMMHWNKKLTIVSFCSFSYMQEDWRHMTWREKNETKIIT